MKQKVLSALKWLAAARLVGQLISWLLTLIVIRILSPADYGLMAIAMLFISFCTLLNEIGLGSALIQIKKLDETIIKKAFGLILLINFILFILLIVLSPIIADFFGEQELVAILRTLSIQFIIMSFAVVPEALLERGLDFKLKSIVFLIAVVIGGLVTLYLAANDYEVWSLVWGNLTVVTIKSIGLNIIAPRLYLPRLDLSGMKDLISFGGLVTLQRTLWFFYTQADIFIAGKILGKEFLGFYNVAMHIATLPMKKVSGIINQVAFPAFSQIQADMNNVRFYLLKSVRIMSFFVFPVFWGISMVANEIVTVILTPKWNEAIEPLQIISLVLPLRMISNLMPSVMQGIGRADIGVKNLLFASIVMPPAFYIGSYWGVIGLSLSWLIAFPIVFIGNTRRSITVLSIRYLDFVKAMLMPAIASAIMCVILIVLRSSTKTMFEDPVRLMLFIPIGAITYSTVILIINRNLYREVFSLLKK